MLTISKKKSVQSGWRLYRRLEEPGLLTTGGQAYSIRQAERSDLPLLAGLLSSLSDDTRYLRFLSYVPPFNPERAAAEAVKLWLENPWPGPVLLAVLKEGEREKAIGLGELHIDPRNYEEAEFALVVSDKWQAQGIGTLLLNRLTDLAARHRVRVLQAEMLAQNQTMRRLLTRLHRPLHLQYESGSLRVRLELSEPIPA